MNDPTVGIGYLVGLFGVVVSGAVLPVVPTGAAVSVAAAYAAKDHLWLIAAAIAFGAAGAYVGDLATYAVLRVAGQRMDAGTGRLSGWVHRQSQGKAVARAIRQIDEHELRTLLLSRLVPGGQLPVLVVAAVGGYSWRRFAVADLAAATLWSVMYAGTGVAGSAVFPKAWEGAAAGIALVLLVSLASSAWSRRHNRTGSGSDQAQPTTIAGG